MEGTTSSPPSGGVVVRMRRLAADLSPRLALRQCAMLATERVRESGHGFILSSKLTKIQAKAVHIRRGCRRRGAGYRT
jgi:hypothetical protein